MNYKKLLRTDLDRGKLFKASNDISLITNRVYYKNNDRNKDKLSDNCDATDKAQSWYQQNKIGYKTYKAIISQAVNLVCSLL